MKVLCAVFFAVLTLVGVAAPPPDGYRALAFVESTGEQALDTGVAPTVQTRVVCDCLFTATNSPQRCGMVKGTSLFMWGRESAYAGRYGSIVSTSWNDRGDSHVDWDVARHVFDLKSGSQKLDGAEYATHVFSPSGTQSLWLFGTHYDAQTTVSYPCHMQLYGCRIYDGEALVRDYVPAQSPDGTVGLYDCVNDEFAAPRVGRLYAKCPSSLPAGYVERDYVESTGTQVLDTGVKAGPSSRVVCDCLFTDLTKGQRCGSSDLKNMFLWGLEGAYDGRFGSIVSTTWNNREDSGLGPDSDRHVFDLRSGSQKLDGAQYGTHRLTAASVRNLWLFGTQEQDYQISFGCRMKLFACRIYEDAVLVRDYVPVRAPDGRLGLYDLANGTFSMPMVGLLSDGASPALPAGYRLLEYVESDGTQYLDTGVPARTRTRVLCDGAFTTLDSPQRSGMSKGSTVFLWGLESAFKGHFGSIVDKDWNTREDSKVSGDTARHVFDLRPGAQWLDAVRYGTHAYTADSTYTFRLFAANEGTTTLRYPCSLRLYACQICEGEEARRNYVPAQEVSSRCAGLYDLVSGQFFPATVGELTAGPRVEIPGTPKCMCIIVR